MEDDIDIYADLPNINLNLDKNDPTCDCKNLKEELNLLKSKFEDIQKTKENLEINLSSLLKTARAEIARKDKMIGDLRKRLNDAIFRRNNKGERPQNFSAHRSLHQRHKMVEKYEIAPSIQKSEITLHKTESQCDEHKSKESQYDVQLPTIFAERLHKKIIKIEEESTKQRTSSKLDIEPNSKGTPEENIVGSDKENGSQLNNNGNESRTITQHSDSENPWKKNLGKRKNEEDDTHESKRLKINDSEGKMDETDHNCTARYELKDNLEMKNNLSAKLENRFNVGQSLKKEEISLDKRRAASEHRNITKQSRDYINDWKKEKRSNSRIASTSNHVLEEPNNDYKKNSYRSNSSRRSYSRSRSDYESSSGHHLRERSSRTYRNKRKYDDYKYENQYRIKRDYKFKRDYESIENESKTRRRNKECNKSRHLTSDAADKDENISNKNKKYKSRRTKEMTPSTLYNKDLHEKPKTVADSRAFSSRAIVDNTEDHSAKEITEQNKLKNESNIKPINSTESMTYISTKDLSNLEEGEIVDSPEKKIYSMKISEDYDVVQNDTNIVLIENENKDVPVITSVPDDNLIPLQNDVIITNQLNDVRDIETKEIEASHLIQTTLEDPGEILELNICSKNNVVIDEVQECNNVEDICKSQCNDDLTDLTTCISMQIEQVCDRIVNDDDKNCMEKESKTSVSETAVKIEGLADSPTESATESKIIDDPNIESAINKDEVNNSNVECLGIITEANNSDNSSRKIDDKEFKNSTVKVVAKIETVFSCEIVNGDTGPISNGNKASPLTTGKNNVEMSHLCLSDHNYIQDPSVNTSNFDIVRESPVSSGYCEIAPEAKTSKETKAEEKTDVSLTVGVKKTMSSTVKNKKNPQQSKGIVIMRRRRAVTLSDSSASMTILMNKNTSSNVISKSNNESMLKPRACKASRSCK